MQHDSEGESSQAMRTESIELPSDDFLGFPVGSELSGLSAADQVARDRKIRESGPHELSFWQTTPPELTPLSRLAMKVPSLLSTSASVERAFSFARSFTGDQQMAMSQETVSMRTMIQGNWDVAAAFLPEVFQSGPKAWQAANRERKVRKQAGALPWRLGQMGREDTYCRALISEQFQMRKCSRPSNLDRETFRRGE
jgi:hypothetical protein